MITTWTQAVLTIIACSAIAGLWAVFRPDLVRDNDGRRLPYSLTARVAFTVLLAQSFQVDSLRRKSRPERAIAALSSAVDL